MQERICAYEKWGMQSHVVGRFGINVEVFFQVSVPRMKFYEFPHHDDN